MLYKVSPLYIGLFMLGVFFAPANASAAALYWYSTGIGAQTTQWDDLDNWWEDSNHSVQASSIPGTSDTVTIATDTDVYPVVDLDTWTAPESIDAPSGDITFTSANDTTYAGTLTVGGTMHMRGSAIFGGDLVGASNFHDTSMNMGTVEGLAQFYDTSRNHSTGYIQYSSAEFYDTSVNAGYADQNMTFYNSSYNDGGSGNALQVVTFNDSSYNTGSITGGTAVYFNENSHNDGSVQGLEDTTFTFPAINNGTVQGRAIFTGGTYTLLSTLGTNGSITLDNLHLSGTDSWYDQFPNTTVINWYFTGSSTNEVAIDRPGTETITFEENAVNNSVVTASNLVSFFDNTSNNSEVTAPRIHFNDSSSNGLSGNLIATEEITFYGGTSNNLGTQSTPSMKIVYSSNTTTTLNFVTGGPWTVVADGAVVNYCSATYNQTTTFSAINGGSFVSCSTPSNNSNTTSSNTSTQMIGPTGGSSAPAYSHYTDTPQNIPPTTTTTTTTPLFTRTISLYTAHPDVKKLQKFLNNIGFTVSKKGFGSPGKETMIFGLKTYAALKKFQKTNNLPVTGRLDVKTLELMNSLGK